MKILKGDIEFCPSDKEVNNLMLSKYNPNMIYKNPGIGASFGDSLAWASFIARLSEASNQTIKVVRMRPKAKTIFSTLLNTTGTYEEVKNHDPALLYDVRNWPEVYAWKNIPARKLWVPNQSKVVAYQFGTKGASDRLFQIKEEEQLVLDAISNSGFNPIEVGAHLTNEACMKLVSECMFFVGTCSGMSHLCHSVGTPTHIICNNRLVEKVKLHHSGNSLPTTYWQKPIDFIGAINEIKKW